MEVTVDGIPAAARTRCTPADDPERFREVLGRFATGVGVMTTVVEGRHHGMTANAFSSVSLDPPLVLVCVERGTQMATSVLAGEVFALSFLSAHQEALSQRFADPARARGDAQFEALPTHGATTGAAILVDATGWVDCRLWASYDGGDHLIVVGEVVDLGVGEVGDPLIYHRSRYARLATGTEDGAAAGWSPPGGGPTAAAERGTT